MGKIEIGTKYRHYKNKNHIYEVVGVARHSETLEEMVVYKALYESEEFGRGVLWVRPKDMFLGNVIINGEEIRRFEKIN